MNKIELLAPAGTMEKMKMALLYGADAVYLAGKVFGLRAYGGNFTKEEMKEAVRYAHGMGKKVYVTVNIIPRNEDLEGLDDYLRYLEEIHVDAALISDLGVFSLAREVAPTLPIHVSTQASAANWRTVKVWKEMGAERVVLAREVSVKEMADIRKRWISSWRSSDTARCAFPGPVAACFRIFSRMASASRTAANVSRPAASSIRSWKSLVPDSTGLLKRTITGHTFSTAKTSA